VQQRQPVQWLQERRLRLPAAARRPAGQRSPRAQPRSGGRLRQEQWQEARRRLKRQQQAAWPPRGRQVAWQQWQASAAARRPPAMRDAQPEAARPRKQAPGAAAARSCGEQASARLQPAARMRPDERRQRAALRRPQGALRRRTARAGGARRGPRLPAASFRELPSRRRRRGAPATSRSSPSAPLRGAIRPRNRRGPSGYVRGHARLRQSRWNWSASSSRSRQLRSEHPGFPGS
jgi:hypothetical protein